MKYIEVNIGNVTIGNSRPIAIQTMCNCDTNDIEAAVRQCTLQSQAGAQIIRLTTQGIKEVNSLKKIKEILRHNGISTPLVADIHFSPETAIAAASVAEKVRINPGNFSKDHDEACRQFKNLISTCKKNNTAIRIGINHGSLGPRITELYGNTPMGMKEAIKEWVEMAIQEGFYSIVLSLKASNVIVMVEAYQLLNEWMVEKGIIFPLHLGVTEAGNGNEGRIKSSVGIASLLSQGIGDTIRVSLTENPINEIVVAKYIKDFFSNYKKRSVPEDLNFRYITKDYEEFIVKASCEIGPHLINKEFKDFSVSAICGEKELSAIEIDEFKKDILQASRILFSKCEYIACPSCGRTLYDIEKSFNEVKKKTSHLKGVVIAVMGCIVNGPGEMADADFGYIGEGRGKVTLYRGKEAVMRSIPQEEAVDRLVELIEKERQIKH